MKVSRRGFLKGLFAACSVVAIAPKVAYDIFKEEGVHVESVAKIKTTLGSHYDYRTQARRELAEWWAKEFDRQLMEIITRAKV